MFKFEGGFSKDVSQADYLKSFLDLSDGTVYLDTMKKVDLRPTIGDDVDKAIMNLRKAQSVAGLAPGTTDLSLIPVYVDPTLVDLTRRRTPLVELIPRVTNYGRTADYNQITARGTSGFMNEDAALPEVDDSFGRRSTPIRYLYSVGRVTGPMLAASRQYLSNQYIDALNKEVRNKTISLRYFEEDTIVNGSATSRTAYGNLTTTAGTEFVGLRGLISTNADAQAGASISIAALRNIIRRSRTANDSGILGESDPNLLVTDYKTIDDIKGLLQDYQRYITEKEIAWGITTITFEGLPLLATKFMPTGVAAKEVLCLSTDTIQMRVLQDVTYEELAKTNDSYKFLLKCYEALICTAEQFNGKITGLA